MRRQGPPSAPRISRNRFSRTCDVEEQGRVQLGCENVRLYSMPQQLLQPCSTATAQVCLDSHN